LKEHCGKQIEINWGYEKKGTIKRKGNCNKINPDKKEKFPNKLKKIQKDFKESFNNFLEDNDKFKDKEDEFCYLLKLYLSNIPIYYHNEYMLSCIIFESVLRINKTIKEEENKIKFFSFDKKFNENIVGFDLNFRVDIILLVKNKLFIFENKFRVDRLNQSKNALKCIEFKRYSERTLNFFKNYYNGIYQKIEFVYEVGLAYSKLNNDITATLHFNTIPKYEFNLEVHKTINFVATMRKNLKRFIKICEDNNI